MTVRSRAHGKKYKHLHRLARRCSKQATHGLPGFFVFPTMFQWLRKPTSPPASSSRPDDTSTGIRPNVFFRTQAGFLQGADLETVHDDIPAGAPILHYFCYKYEHPWHIHQIVMDVWRGGQTATFGMREPVLVELCFSDWDNGWLMAISKTQSATDAQFRDFVNLTQRYLSEIEAIFDVRWFPDDVLTCGLFHEGDFEYGTLTPFEP
jgi:hypothetical protein